MDFTGGLSQAVSQLPAEFQPVLTAVMDRLAALEAQGAKDSQILAQQVIDGVKSAIQPAVEAVNTVALTVNASVTEITALARRIDGATFTAKLGPE
jgi:hypothetical protein